MTEAEGIPDHVVPKLPRGVKLRQDKIRDCWTLLGPERVLVLDQIGLEILNRCDGTRNLGGVISDLAEAFETDADVVGPDVRAFLLDLRNRGFVELQ